MFAPLTDIIEGLDEEKRGRWQRLWQVSDSRMENIHPLVYLHPVTKKKVKTRNAFLFIYDCNYFIK